MCSALSSALIFVCLILQQIEVKDQLLAKANRDLIEKDYALKDAQEHGKVRLLLKLF